MTLTSGLLRGRVIPVPNTSAPSVFAPFVCPHLACMSARMLVVVNPPPVLSGCLCRHRLCTSYSGSQARPLLVAKGFRGTIFLPLSLSLSLPPPLRWLTSFLRGPTSFSPFFIVTFRTHLLNSQLFSSGSPTSILSLPWASALPSYSYVRLSVVARAA